MNNWFKRNITSPLINFLGQKKAEKHFTEGPILIGGCGRSGTTLLLAMISAHPKVFAIPEETDAFTNWLDKGGKQVPERLDRFYREILKSKIPKTCNRWCEKRPYNVRYIKEILAYFGPKAKFIHIIRDPRAVCTSHHPRRSNEYWIDPERYITDVQAGLAFENHTQVLTIKYERLIDQTGQVLEEICDFLELQYGKEMASWFDYATVRKNRAWKHGLKHVHSNSLHKWQQPQNTDRLKAILSDKTLVDLGIRLGYDLNA